MQLEKATKRSKPETKRGYEDACGTAHALELIGERWAPLVLRELMFGPRRFSGLKADLPGISANVLIQRLTELEERGLVRRIKLPPPASVQVYEATDWGLEAAPLLRALGKWAVRSPRHDVAQFVSPVSIMMSMQTMFDPAKADGFAARLAFRFGERSYVAEVADRDIEVRQAPAEGADVVFDASPQQLAGFLYGGAPIETVAFTGDKATAQRFAGFFELPPKAF
ncbi:helix-turn-helix transcriptional regulator [Sphingomonas sinipercae]|uniref:Helix-turn-helix transcriptional regulator n=1 Tax=Sphingomonas sinipercae TaxID=2714944 RepID=A0A6G7ZLF3_9SPHN|nr:helix-turn-helix domain-containing protein [Sphingomonas sinipercae]QIL01726.1 helix-turn-helix transcriptional regulator [Sphingomonas sinipercae]